VSGSLKRDLGLLLILATTWSLSFSAIKIGVEVIPPITLAMLRVALGALVLYVWLKFKGQSLPRDPRVWGMFFLIGLSGSALPFSLINWGEQHIASGLAAILVATMPLAALVLGRLFSDEVFSVRRLLGVLVGVAGVVVLIGPEALLTLGDEVLRQLAVAFAAVLYAVSAILIRKLPGSKPLQYGTGALMASALILFPASLLFEQPWTIDFTPQSVAAVVYLGVFPTALAMLLLVVVIASQGVTFLSLNNYLIPLLGVLWGALFLGEVVTPQVIAALVLIFCGIAVAGGGHSVRKSASS